MRWAVTDHSRVWSADEIMAFNHHIAEQDRKIRTRLAQIKMQMH